MKKHRNNIYAFLTKMKKLARETVKTSYKVVADFFSKSYSYHASAITFSGFLVSNTAVIFLGTILKYIPQKQIIISKIYELFPNISENIVKYFVTSVENLTLKVQLITLFLIIFFIGNFLRNIELAFAFIAETKPRKIPLINYFLPFIFGVLLVFYGSIDVILGLIPKILEKFHIYHSFVLKVIATFKMVINYLAFPLGLTVIYYFLSPTKVKFRTSLAVSLGLALLLNPLKSLFTWYTTHYLIKNLVITPFAGILVFLVWFYIMAIFLLLGYRFILFLQRF